MRNRDLEFLLAVSPALEILTVTGNLTPYVMQSTNGIQSMVVTPFRARLTNRSLRCAQFCLTILGEVAVVDAPSLERLFLYKNWNERHGLRHVTTTVKIGHAPKLHVLGYLEPGVHLLQINDTIIQVRA
jgi:hypothetical protein